MNERTQDYVILIEAPFGEFKVEFESGILDGEDDVYKKAMKKLEESELVNMDKLNDIPHCYEIIEGETLDSLS